VNVGAAIVLALTSLQSPAIQPLVCVHTNKMPIL
jgi:hypothetical protein